ncbi:MAG: hypothetical protein A2W91_17855 [Bacteroidetes bacterium GWF2_38_335]|nr:MAG: hypothetical protein A2W91_17855 [Bacteroidetes bacterium GWF2_38_335]OFY80162.1 MAG: hypothetical protein A2281_12785 [Bacteroidetes bacterium RIFOXYA12_FULL_38_20]HBS88509.1 helicase SNF2 [Bacteroidales bacterium]
MTEEFIVALRKYKNLGVVPFLYLVNRAKGSEFAVVSSNVTLASLKSNSFKFTPIQEELLRIVNEYNEVNLFKLFAKNYKTQKDFFDKVKPDFIENHIRPYIEKRIYRLMLVLIKSDIRLYYKNDKFSNIYDSDEIMVEKNEVKTVFNFHKNVEGTKYFLSIKSGNKEISLTGKPGEVIVNEPSVMIIDHVLYVFSDIDSKKLSPFLSREHIHVPPKLEKQYFTTFVSNAIRNYEVNASGFVIEELNPEIKPMLMYSAGLDGKPVLILEFQYGRLQIRANDKVSVFVEKTEEKGVFHFKKTVRDQEKENYLSGLLTKMGLKECHKGIFEADRQSQNTELIRWINENLKNLEKNGFALSQDFYGKRYFLDKISLEIRKFSESSSEEKDWFGVFAVVHFGEFKIPFIKLKNNILTGNREFILPDGSTAILPEEWFTEYRDLLQYSRGQSEKINVAKHHVHLINNVVPDLNIDFFSKMREIYSNGNNPENYKISDKIKASLRPYQRTGAGWLKLLHESRFGGCLADDMGLGKTLQTLTHLTSVYENDKPVVEKKIIQVDLFTSREEIVETAKQPPSIIVMPTSLLHNWAAEIMKFVPHLKFLVHSGVSRTKDFKVFNNYQIILTSYGVLRNDHESLKDFRFLYAILDESQYIKNPTSKIYSAVKKINSEYRIVLTGTPVENSITDLWSQMNFINPGLLGDLTFFGREFVFPIERCSDAAKSEKLKKLISPFILRRRKDDVEKDLPDITEQEVVCEMSELQQKVYETEKSKIRNAIIENITEQKGKNDLAVFILQGLMKLRQIACHPKIIDPGYNDLSGKFEEIAERIQVLAAGNHKVLIFSSFVRHLELFRGFLEEKSIEYSLLTGEMNQNERRQAIDRFQDDEDNKVFLISMKSGGTGLNLTAADYVFIIDPWWNPAVESQAVSRAHRIGQNKKVFVYRFISENTVEEKIQKLKIFKAGLADDFINSNNPLRDLDLEDMKSLFEN